MSDEATVERVAKEMWAARRARGLYLMSGQSDIGPWEAENGTLHENVRCEARAALAAMGNPLPKCTSWLGHKFEARYSLTPPTLTKVGPGEDARGTIMVIESLTRREYEGDICTRCGCVVNRPPNSTEKEKP